MGSKYGKTSCANYTFGKFDSATVPADCATIGQFLRKREMSREMSPIYGVTELIATTGPFDSVLYTRGEEPFLFKWLLISLKLETVSFSKQAKM